MTHATQGRKVQPLHVSAFTAIAIGIPVPSSSPPVLKRFEHEANEVIIQTKKKTDMSQHHVLQGGYIFHFSKAVEQADCGGLVFRFLKKNPWAEAHAMHA